MRIRIKVKHLVYAVGLLTVLIIAFNYATPDGKKLAEAGPGAGGADAAVTKALILQKIDLAKADKKLEFIKKFMIDGSDTTLSRSFETFIGPGGSYESHAAATDENAIPRFGIEEKAPYLEAYVKEASPDTDMGNAALMLSLYYEGAGQTAKAQRMLEDARKRLANNPDMKSGYAMKELTYREAKLAAEQDQGIQELTDVSGTLTRSDGTPLAYAGVFLRSRRDVNNSINDSEPYQTMTDANGQYVIKGVLPGAYQIHIGLNLDQISGWTWPGPYDDWIDVKGQQHITRNIVFQRLLELRSPVNNEVVKDKEITFEWEPVPGAAYYDINLGVQFDGGSSGAFLKSGIRGSMLQVPAEELYQLSGGIVSSSAGNEKLQIVPISLLEFSNPEAQLNWSVEAFDVKGNMITRSDGYRLGAALTGKLPFFYLKERSLTQADRTLLAGDLDTALSQYQEDYKRNPLDTHSLHMIIRVLEGLNSLSGIDNQDQAKEQSARLEQEEQKYLKQMVSLYPTSESYAKIAGYEFKQANWNAYNEYYSLWEKTNDMRDTSYMTGIHGVALMKQGRMEEAEAFLMDSLQHDLSHRFIGAYLACDLYLDGSLKHAAQLAEQFPDRSRSDTSLDWMELVDAMINEAASSSAYPRMLQDNIASAMQTGKYEAPAGHLAMKAFLKAVMDVR
ncbi:carboxypeptidase-like regulatory domain-containing protein [Paenibacillus chibensis]|uniref:Carboxypeptidase-like regulatory domain-containing protein n=1 Tax=Paenibacillus chibensis TaxID=59846 RepID=A0ABU6PLN6_9BACL|nr:carboxypeptidase-like regulatory domain-containing protein [Paenibacillus chibensis]